MNSKTSFLFVCLAVHCFYQAAAQTTLTTTPVTSTAVTSTVTTTVFTTTTAANASNATTTTPAQVCLLRCLNGGTCYNDPDSGEMLCLCPGNWAGGLCETNPNTKVTFNSPCTGNWDCVGFNEFCTSHPGGYRYTWPSFTPYVPLPVRSNETNCTCPNATTIYVSTTTVGLTTIVTTTAVSSTTTTTTTTTSWLTTTAPNYSNTSNYTVCICPNETLTTALPTTTVPTTTPRSPGPIVGVCYCQPGYYYSTAMAGCAPNDPCAMGETCQQIYGGWCEYKESTLNCSCPYWMTDVYCNATVPIWGNWSDWSNCSTNCGICRQERSRPCINHLGEAIHVSWCNNHFVTGRGQIDIQYINFTTPCLSPDNPCLRDPCNSNTFNHTQLHTCVQSITSSDGFICSCAPGYVNRGNSPLCYEDNKCFTTNDCQRGMPGTSAQRTCVNWGLGNYTCLCPTGFQRDPTDTTYRKCIDVNECTSGAANCDTSDRATCYNTIGSYYCQCNTNFVGSGTLGTCVFDIFGAMQVTKNFTYIPPPIMQSVAPTSNASAPAIPALPIISSRFPVPLMNSLYASRFYMTWNGLIVMTNYSEEEYCDMHSFSSPPISGLSSFKAPNRTVGIVAPYWTSYGAWLDSDANYTNKYPRGIYYLVLHNQTSIMNAVYASQQVATPLFQLFVIWHRMQYVANPHQASTFYAWISSDFVHTWAGAGYGDKMMGWNILQPLSNYPVRVGVWLSNGLSIEWNNSWASVSSNTAVAALQAPDTVLGMLTTQLGKAIQWTIGDESSKASSPYYPCGQWALDAFTQPRYSKMQQLSTYCPPNRAMTLGMYRFSMTFNNSWMACYQWEEGFSFENDYLKAGCCYDLFTGTILPPQSTLTFDIPGYVQRSSSGANTLLTDHLALTYCCLPYRAPVCNYFQSTSGTSINYRAPAIATAYGGGHIVTFDGYQYVTHNLGEFTLADIYDPRFGNAALRARLQGRLSLASSVLRGGYSPVASSWNWTVFTSFAVKVYNPDSDIVEVRISNNNQSWGYDILINHVPIEYMPGNCSQPASTTTSTARTISSSATSPTTTTTTSTTTSTSTTTMTGSTTTTTLSSTTTTPMSLSTAPTCSAEPSPYPCEYTGNRLNVRYGPGWVVIGMYSGAVVKIRASPYSLGATFLTAMDWNDNTTGLSQIYKGLFGNRNGNPNDEMQTNFGVQFDTSQNSVSTVAKSWLVTQSSSLFTYSASSNYQKTRLAALGHNPSQGKSSSDAVNAASQNVSYGAVSSACFNDDSCMMDAGLFANIYAGRYSAESNVCFKAMKNASLAFPVVPANLTSGIVLEMIMDQAFSSAINLTSPTGLTFTIQAISVPTGFQLSGNQFSASNVTNINDTSVFLFSATDSNGVASLIIPAIEMCSCANNGTCKFGFGYTMFTDVSCVCPPGSSWTGAHCDIDLDPCSLLPCSSGFCSRNDTYRNLYTCKPCPAPYVGDGTRCYVMDYCGQNSSICSGLATCRNSFPSYTCVCPSGWVPDAGGSCEDINECYAGTAKCNGNQTCLNTPGSYACTCPSGFRLNEASNNCLDVNECLESANGPCSHMNNSVCINSIGSYSCQCAFGYTPSPDKTTCIGNNPCFLPTMNCDGYCTPGNGSYSCSCRTGLNLYGQTICNPVTNCSSTQTATCGSSSQSLCYINSDGTTGCTCRGRYEISNGDCVDINECTRNLHMCDLSVSQCLNLPGTYKCQCNNGYYLGPDGVSCLDVDECLSNNGSCSGSTSTCVNTPGSFYCVCKKGYQLALNSDGVTYSCSDVNECQTGLDECSDVAICVNTVGSYTCTCPSGYTGTGQYCNDINECLANPCPYKAICTNTLGSYNCTCQEGTVNVSNTCTDVDWCSFSSIVCPSGSSCSNVAGGSFTCSCPSGYTYDGFNCVGPRSCAHTTCPDPVGQVCVVNPTTFAETCQCRTGFSLSVIVGGFNCTSINRCSTVNTAGKTFASLACPSSTSTCVDTLGSYSCQCAAGYQLSLPGVCSNINECLNVSTCPLGAICTDLPPPALYSCDCPAGYTLQKGVNSPIDDKCVPINACAAGLATCASSTLGGVCTAGNGNYTCSCAPGWTGDGYSCYDVNECAAAMSPCPQGCTNTAGSYTCFCYSGYTMDGFGVCQDVNECQLLTSNCDQTCINTHGSYTCSCQDGFVLESDGHTCKASQTCPATAGCSQLCAMINGSPKCYCKNTVAYTLSGDGRTCVQNNLCATSPCSGIYATCMNIMGGFNCTCSNGFKQSADGLKCVDRDGGWSDWSSWSSCTVNCGGGTQYQNRSCNNPTPVAAGLQCSGVSIQTQSCNTGRCTFSSTEQQYAVDSTWTLSSSRINFVTAFETSGDQIRQYISNTINSKCRNSPSSCCGGSSSDSSYNQSMIPYSSFSKPGYVTIGNLFQSGTNFQFSTAVKADKGNSLCSLAPVQARKKRDFFSYNTTTQIMLPQNVLTNVMSDSTLQQSINNYVLQTYGISITWSSIGGASNPTQATTVTTTATNSVQTSSQPTSSSGIAAWVIPVAVVCAVVFIAIIIVVVIVVVKKRPPKVADGTAGSASKDKKSPKKIEETKKDAPKKEEAKEAKKEEETAKDEAKKSEEPKKKEVPKAAKADAKKKSEPEAKKEPDNVDEIELKKTSTTTTKKKK